MRMTTRTVCGRSLTRRTLRRAGIAACFALFVLALPGCSVFMAAKQPDKRDLGLMTQGTPRAVLIEEFGEPVATKEVEGRKAEVFRFIQGYSNGTKMARAMFHGTADVLTLGLWEVVGTPAESVFDGEKLYYEVTYDENDRVASAVAFKE